MNANNAFDLSDDITRLRAVELKLLGIDEDDLNQDEKNKLAKQLNNCGALILKLEGAVLQNLADEFKSREKKLREATAKLENDIGKLNNAVQIIDTAASALGTISELATSLVGL